jgi:hypothetical protein
MISNVGSVQSSQAATQSRKLEATVEARPVEPRQRAASTTATSPSAAAVVQIGGQARALATQNEAAPQTRTTEASAQRATSASLSAARPRLGDSSEARTELEIEPVVSQPVPDFSASSARSVYASSSGAQTSTASQAQSSSRQFVA